MCTRTGDGIIIYVIAMCAGEMSLLRDAMKGKGRPSTYEMEFFVLHQFPPTFKLFPRETMTTWNIISAELFPSHSHRTQDRNFQNFPSFLILSRVTFFGKKVFQCKSVKWCRTLSFSGYILWQLLPSPDTRYGETKCSYGAVAGTETRRIFIVHLYLI